MATLRTRPTIDFRIRRYVGYVAAFNAGRALLQSTIILYLVDVVRLPLAWTSLLLAIDLAVTLFAEIPTGVFADLRGRRRSFIAACALSSIGVFVYGLPLFLSLTGPPPLLFLFAAAGEAIVAIGFTFYSGALDAWAVDTIPAARSAYAKQILAKGQLAKSVSFLISGEIGILVYFSFGNSVVLNTFFFGGTILGATFVHALADMEEGSEEIRGNMERAKVRIYQRLLLSVLRSSFADARLLQFLLASATSFALMQILIHFWPYYITKEASAPAYERIGMLALMLSWALAYGARSLGNYLATFSLRGDSYLLQLGIAALLNSLFVAALSLGSDRFTLASVGPIAASVLYAGVRFLDGFAEPIRIGVLTDFTEARTRATLYSVHGFACMLLSAIGAIAATAAISLGISIAQIWLFAAALQIASVSIYLLLWKSRRHYASSNQ